ncbi:MAG: bL17 family ribosomal protein [Patescibacteria group bacterium]|jgi:large subunit ribosomal protein L17
MRHHKTIPKLGKNKAARTALLNNLVRSFFLHHSLVTTVAKAKAVQPLIEKSITKQPKLKLNKNGGYTRLVHLTPRVGDGAPRAKLELIS